MEFNGRFDFQPLEDGSYEARITEYAEELIVPSEYRGCAVTAVSRDEDAKNANIVNEALLPEGIKVIRNGVFSNCVRMETILLPSTLLRVERDAFMKYGPLRSVYVPDAKSIVQIEFDGPAANPFYFGAELYFIGSGAPVTHLEIPEGVSRIGAYAFCGLKTLVSVALPRGLETIGEGAFFRCNKLIEVNNRSELPLSIGGDAFGSVAKYARSVYGDGYGESRLAVTDGGFIFFVADDVVYLMGCSDKVQQLDLPDGYLGREYSVYPFAFVGQESVRAARIGRGVKAIGESAFSNLPMMLEVIFADDAVIQRIEHCAFLCCDWLDSFDVPSTVSYIGDSAFYGCRTMKSVRIPEGVSYVGDEAFCECTDLTIRCAEQSQPEGWSDEWNPDCCPVLWGE